MTCPV